MDWVVQSKYLIYIHINVCRYLTNTFANWLLFSLANGIVHLLVT